MRFVFAVLALACAACAVDVDVATPPPAPATEGDVAFVRASDDGANDNGAGANDGDGDGANDDSGNGNNDDGANDNGANDDDANDDGATPTEPPGPPPAEAQAACTVWQDCGPWYADRNNGFDCDDGVCACDVDNTYDQACADLGGVWSAEDCFCYVGAAPMPSEDPNTWTDDDESYDDSSYDDNGDPRADRVCWWRWRETCDADRWVDTSSYDYECNGDDCGYEYNESGYWESGDCSGYWIRRCDDGSEKRY